MKITKGKQTRPQRVVIYGVESVGKTTFAAQFPNPLFLDIEGGTAHLNTDRCEINSWAELNGALKEVASSDYQTVIIDSGIGQSAYASKTCSPAPRRPASRIMATEKAGSWWPSV